MMHGYISAISTTLQGLNVGIGAPLANFIATIAVWSVVFYLVSAVIILIGKLTKQIKVVNDVGTKMAGSGCGLFFLFGVLSLYLMRDYFITLLSVFHPKVIAALLKQPGQMVLVIFILALVVVLLLFLLGLLYFCLGLCKDLFVHNIKANGTAKGLFLSLYEFLSGIAWLSAILAAFSISIAIVMVVMVFAATAGRRTRYYYDGRYYYYKDYY